MDRRHALIYNAITKGLSDSGRFVLLSEREAIARRVGDALDADEREQEEATAGLRERLTAALDADPHFTTAEVVATVLRVLGEPDRDLRERLVEALTREHYRRASEQVEASVEEHCVGFADAVLPVVEAWAAEQVRIREVEIDEDIIRPERALHEQTIERAERAERERDEARAAWTAVREESAALVAAYSEPAPDRDTAAARAMAATARRYERERDAERQRAERAEAAVQRARTQVAELAAMVEELDEAGARASAHALQDGLKSIFAALDQPEQT